MGQISDTPEMSSWHDSMSGLPASFQGDQGSQKDGETLPPDCLSPCYAPAHDIIAHGSRTVSFVPTPGPLHMPLPAHDTSSTPCSLQGSLTSSPKGLLKGGLSFPCPASLSLAPRRFMSYVSTRSEPTCPAWHLALCQHTCVLTEPMTPGRKECAGARRRAGAGRHPQPPPSRCSPRIL